jgi:glycosyltransferase involved in cell wall biosynthesis
MQQLSQFDRLTIKREFGINDHLLISTLGLLSPDKGVQYSIRAYGKFLAESCSESQRQKIIYMIAGQPHPEFVKADGGKPYQEYLVMLEEALHDANVRWCKTKDLHTVDYDENDIIFLDNFLDENTLLRFYSASNIIVLPYLNMQQISSGILADTVGAGRVAVTTKFRYALELLHSNKRCQPGLNIGKFARGILVDPGEPSIEQIAKAIDYLVFNKEKRLMMERQAHQRGYQMRWDNSAWALLQYIDFVRDQKHIITGRGVTFARERTSSLEMPRKRTIAPWITAES